MASRHNCGEAPSELAVGDLISVINLSQGKVSEEILEQYAQGGLIDVPDKDGQTPLMIACLKGLEDVVKFLLANGANPNSRTLKECNTPMHYACMIEDAIKEESLSERCYNPSKCRTPRLPILQLLLSYKASLQSNSDGWSPACIAAFYMLEDIVEFFLSMNDDDMPLKCKIKACEVLGVSCITLDRSNSNHAFQSFCRALMLQDGAETCKEPVETSELTTCFSKLSLKEFHILEELKAVGPSETAFKAHAFLVGERVFPPSLKKKYLYPSLACLANRLMFHEDQVEKGFQIFCCALGFERSGELQLGTVLEILGFKYTFHQVSHTMEEPQPLVRQHTRDLMCAYVSVFHNVPIDCLLKMCHSLIDSFGVILFNEAFDLIGHSIMKSTLEDVEKLLRVIRGRIYRERHDEYHLIPSVTLKIMTLLLKRFESSSFPHDFELWFLLQVRYVLLRVLLSDNASYQDRSTGNTLLHTVAYCTLEARDQRDIRCVQDLARAFIRHGCPLDAVSGEGQTARDILEETGSKKPHVKMIEAVLSSPTTVLQLQETAARVVLRQKISYQDILPQRLREMVDGVTDSDLERSVLETNDNSDSDEEKCTGCDKVCCVT